MEIINIIKDFMMNFHHLDIEVHMTREIEHADENFGNIFIELENVIYIYLEYFDSKYFIRGCSLLDRIITPLGQSSDLQEALTIAKDFISEYFECPGENNDA